MYFFIAIILIAELIITVTAICLIMNLDKKINLANKHLLEFRPKLYNQVAMIKTAVTKFVKTLHNIGIQAEEKKQQYLLSIIKNIMIYILLFNLKGKSKKCISAIQLASAIKECFNN